MNTPARLGAYAVGLAVLFAGALAAGNLVRTDPATTRVTGPQPDSHTVHDPAGQDAVSATNAPPRSP